VSQGSHHTFRLLRLQIPKVFQNALRQVYCSMLFGPRVFSHGCVSLALEPEKRGTTPSNTRIQADLGPKLCKGALIYFPSSPEFGEYTKRWSTAAEGDILVVVVPSCDSDVATTVSP
jgi:hypothetical protein